MLSCHLCLLVSCYSFVFCLLSFDCSVCFTASYTYLYIFFTTLLYYSSRVPSPFRGGGIVYLNDPDSYARWSLYTPVRATQARQVEG